MNGLPTWIFVALREADAGFEEVERPPPLALAEPVAPDGERGARHDDGRHFVEELFAHRGADVDRRGGEREPRHAAAALVGFEPVDGALLGLRAPRFQFGGQGDQAIVGGDEVLLLGFFAEFLAGRFDLLRQEFAVRG